MILSAMLQEWLAVVLHFEPIVGDFQWDKCGKCIYIIGDEWLDLWGKADIGGEAMLNLCRGKIGGEVVGALV